MFFDLSFLILVGFGGLMIGMALITKLFPAKKPNRIYGYRTDRTLRNPKTWKFAQLLLPAIFLRLGLYHIVAGIAWYLMPRLSDSLGLMVFFAVLILGFTFEITRSEAKVKKFSREKN
jgi:uncharacterized membrane protein